MLHLLGYLSAILIGISLGLIGGGGALLTLPVLLYIFHETKETASGYSLFIVGTTSLAGAITFIRNKLLDARIVLAFGIPAVLVGFIARITFYQLPEIFFMVGHYAVTKNFSLVILLVLFMALSAYFMISDKDYSKYINADASILKKNLILISLGTIIGIVGGLLAIGGGFLIVPTLVILEGYPVKKAIGTSLMIVSVNLLSMFSIVFMGKEIAGLLGLKKLVAIFQQQAIDWPFLLFFTSLAILGIMLGSYFARHIPGKKLKPAFGVFILLMGIYIFVKELMR